MFFFGKIVRKTYDTIIHLSESRYAIAWLAVISFVESSFFPIPPLCYPSNSGQVQVHVSLRYDLQFHFQMSFSGDGLSLNFNTKYTKCVSLLITFVIHWQHL